MFKGDVGFPDGYCDMSGTLKLVELGLRRGGEAGFMRGANPVFEEVVKSKGRFRSERVGEAKVLRLGLKGWLDRSPLKLGLGAFLGVAVLFDCGVGGAAHFCGACFGGGDVVSSSLLVVLLHFRLCREELLSPFSSTTLAMRSNSEHTPNIRFTPPCSSVIDRRERKLTT